LGDSVYENLSEELLNAGLSDMLQPLESSQNAWSANKTLYCNVLLKIAQPNWGLYARDIENNCLSELTNRRVQDLSLLMDALVEENFEYWNAE
jgi:uncharacterized protein YecT (DUF1311 family)